MPLARRLSRLHLSGQKAQGVPTARRSGNPSGLPRRNNVIDGRVTGTDARSLTAAARCTLRGTSHTRTRAESDTPERGLKEH
ncbi:hypothetical protein EVAR_9699_1 [Eumeta japonica]|uniref:Uncharacterized protein n=1 Tax=Eumeta variegata TaxID=151549 RepID=A0A4C1YC50_EUMVA|nr:hypothetical protein EVAR_9699_1 [Eumeta japonica]